MQEKKSFFQSKEGIAAIVFAIFLAMLFMLARYESKDEWRQAEIDCLRESYEMEKKYGGSAREHEKECMIQREEDRLRNLNP